MSRKDEVVRVWIERAPGGEYWVHSTKSVSPRLAPTLADAYRFAHSELEWSASSGSARP